jgi:hypothetical protein
LKAVAPKPKYMYSFGVEWSGVAWHTTILVKFWSRFFLDYRCFSRKHLLSRTHVLCHRQRSGRGGFGAIGLFPLLGVKDPSSWIIGYTPQHPFICRSSLRGVSRITRSLSFFQFPWVLVFRGFLVLGSQCIQLMSFMYTLLHVLCVVRF